MRLIGCERSEGGADIKGIELNNDNNKNDKNKNKKEKEKEKETETILIENKLTFKCLRLYTFPSMEKFIRMIKN